MQIYHFHKTTGEFIRASEARRDPLEKEEKYLIPANATETEPPPAGADEVAVFENGKWAVKEDRRGVSVWEKATAEEKKITEIGPLPPALTAIEPAVPFPVWDGAKWITDTVAQLESQRQTLKDELQQQAAVNAGLFRMILALWDVGVVKGLWKPADLPDDIRSMAGAWKSKLDEIDAL